MSDNSTRRHSRLMEAWLHKWSDDRARELSAQKKQTETTNTQGTSAPKTKMPKI